MGDSLSAGADLERRVKCKREGKRFRQVINEMDDETLGKRVLSAQRYLGEIEEVGMFPYRFWTPVARLRGFLTMTTASDLTAS